MCRSLAQNGPERKCVPEIAPALVFLPLPLSAWQQSFDLKAMGKSNGGTE